MDDLLAENERAICEANDLSVFGWCTCETMVMNDLDSSCYSAQSTGIYTLRGQNIPVYCDMDIAGGRWMLLLTQFDPISQYEGKLNVKNKLSLKYGSSHFLPIYNMEISFWGR